MKKNYIIIIIFGILITLSEFLFGIYLKNNVFYSFAYITPVIATIFLSVLVIRNSRKWYSLKWDFEDHLQGYIKDKINLQRVNTKYKSLVNTISDLILIVDAEGFILFSNARIWEFTGITSDDVIGRNIKEFINLENNYNESTDQKTSEIKVHEDEDLFDLLVGEKLINRMDGSKFWISLRCNPLYSDDGSEMAFIVNIREITELKEKEKQLQSAKNFAEDANTSKSRFLANMSHELRTPLSSILGYSQFLEMQQVGLLNDKQEKYIEYIMKSGEHLLEMVNDILDLAKIEAGKIKIEKSLFDLNLMLSRSPSTIKAVADKKKVEMVLNVQGDLGFVNADEVRIKQVIYNLLSNAIKFTEPGNKVGIDATANEDIAAISVWDEGCGIPEEDLSLIFEPFEQSDSTGSKSSRGTGLGLSISRKLIELHGGTLSVSSKVGIGSHFLIVLPGRFKNNQSEKNSVQNIIEVPVHSHVSGKIVMLIDNNEMIAELVKNILTVSGYGVVHFCSGEEAIQYIRDGNSCNLVLTDIALSGIDGIKMMHKIKGIMGQKIPFIALTGYAMKGDRDTFLNAGFENYISKPFNINSLLSTVYAAVMNEQTKKAVG